MSLRAHVWDLVAVGGLIMAGCDSGNPLTGNDPLTPTTGTIRVMVVSDGGAGIGLSVTVNLTGPAQRAATTKVGAAATFTDLPAGTYTASAASPRFVECASVSVSLLTGRSADADIHCARRIGTITGIVSTEDEPLAATVTRSSEGSRQTKTTAPDGSFVFSAPAGENVLEASSDGYTCPARTVLVEMGETMTADLSCTPKPTGSLEGRVVSGDQILPFVVVTIVGPENLEAVTDDRGSFLFRDIAPGRYTLTVASPGPDCPLLNVDVQSARTVALVVSCEFQPPIGSEIEGNWSYVRLLREQTGTCAQPLSGTGTGSISFFGEDEIEIVGLDPDLTITGRYDETSGFFSGTGTTVLVDGSRIETDVVLTFSFTLDFLSLDQPFAIFATDQEPSEVMTRRHHDTSGTLTCTEVYGADGVREG